jgi:hypothetical protein
MATLEEAVRERIGNEGPQLPTQEYEDRIDEELKHLTVPELLHHISRVFEEGGFNNFQSFK